MSANLGQIGLPMYGTFAQISPPQSPVRRAGRTGATGDWSENVSANLGQIGRHISAPVASRQPRISDVGRDMRAELADFWGGHVSPQKSAKYNGGAM